MAALVMKEDVGAGFEVTHFVSHINNFYDQ